MNPNNSYVGYCTRTYISEYIDRDLFNAVENTLYAIRPNSPSGMVYGLIMDGNGDDDIAEMCGVAVELWYAACSLTDDIQDGESEYAGKTLSEQINVQSILICLSFTLFSKLGLSNYVSNSGVEMLKGQYIDIAYKKITAEDYCILSRAIGGKAFGTYFLTCARGIYGIDVEKMNGYRIFGEAYGFLLNIIVDRDTKDKRWCNLENYEKNWILDRAVSYFETIAVEKDFEKIKRGLLDRV